MNTSGAGFFRGVVGDGVHDDTAGIQSALDTGAGMVYLPQPKSCYLISRLLAVHTGQTLLADRNATIRLADQANCVMLENFCWSGESVPRHRLAGI